MDTYKTRLQEQQVALLEDVKQLITNIQNQEIILDEMKDRKSQAQRELRSIEKKLAKL